MTNGLENPCLKITDSIKLLGRVNGETIQGGMDEVCQWPVGWDLPQILSNCQRLMEGEADLVRHMGPSGHEDMMNKENKQGALGY